MEQTNLIEHPDVQELISLALKEDLGLSSRDVTSEVIVPSEEQVFAQMITREACCLAGAPIAVEVFKRVDPRLECAVLIGDGTAVERGRMILTVKGNTRSILSAERTALNFIQHMSGISTVTANYIKAAGNPDVMLLDTRKTTPGHRTIEKYAVRCGGGTNHRTGLYDAVLIKDNHLVSWKKKHGLGEAVTAARAQYPDLQIEIEVDTVEQLKEVLIIARPDWVLLDNMPLPALHECAAFCKGICKTEASGGINFDTVYDIAHSGVDALSIGALTHSAPSVDLALEFVQ